jgi:hypothetical protein
VYGFIGIGAIVQGLCMDIEQAPAILLSPSNAENIDADNQSVVDGASGVVLCLWQQDARAALDDRIFSEVHIICLVFHSVKRRVSQ